jgi:hypothetical protein
VVAHHVSLIAVQAEATGALLPDRPDAAAKSADLIAATARAQFGDPASCLLTIAFQSPSSRFLSSHLCRLSLAGENTRGRPGIIPARLAL